MMASSRYVRIMKETIAQKRDSKRRRIRFRTRGSSIGIVAASTDQIVSKLERGFSFQSLRELESQSGISIAMIASVVGIPERTLARRRATERLTTQESERLLRIAILFEKTVELFEGDVAAATRWLTTPQQALGRRSPLLYARTEPGAREVESLIGRLEHGVFS